MREQYQLIVIEPSELKGKVAQIKEKNARLVQICAVSVEGGYELSYSFAIGYEFINYRVNINEDIVMESISDVFPASSLYENEISELFGVKINHIKLDYHDKLYQIEAETPFKR